MSIIVNIYYTGQNGNAKKFVDEMLLKGIVKNIRNEEGNEKYEYFYSVDNPETVLLIDKFKDQNALDMHHKSEMMKEIAQLREKYKLHLKIEKFTEI